MPRPWLIKRAVEEIGPDRVIFGSDGPGCDPRLELFKVKHAGLTALELDQVLGGTCARLIGSAS